VGAAGPARNNGGAHVHERGETLHNDGEGDGGRGDTSPTGASTDSVRLPVAAHVGVAHMGRAAAAAAAAPAAVAAAADDDVIAVVDIQPDARGIDTPSRIPGWDDFEYFIHARLDLISMVCFPVAYTTSMCYIFLVPH